LSRIRQETNVNASTASTIPKIKVPVSPPFTNIAINNTRIAAALTPPQTNERVRVERLNIK